MGSGFWVLGEGAGGGLVMVRRRGRGIMLMGLEVVLVERAEERVAEVRGPGAPEEEVEVETGMVLVLGLGLVGGVVDPIVW